MRPFPIDLKEFIFNLFLDLKSKIRYILKIKKYGNFQIPDTYKKVFTDDFKDISIPLWEESSTWWCQPYHPGYLFQWFDPKQVSFNSEGIEFHAVVKPKSFADGEISNAIGCIRTKESWRFGIFRFVAKMPEGTYLWPALWMTSDSGWPPEIDLLEGYSGDTTNYKNSKILQSNIHYTYNNQRFHISGKNHYLPNNVIKDFVEYTIWWEEDFVRIYYNGYLVREITEPKILEALTGKQVIVIGTGCQELFDTDNITPLVVSKVEVFQT